eukprot:762949-Hanusia_phi.AAC.9
MQPQKSKQGMKGPPKHEAKGKKFRGNDKHTSPKSSGYNKKNERKSQEPRHNKAPQSQALDLPRDGMGKWYEFIPEHADQTSGKRKKNEERASELKEKARQYLEAEVARFEGSERRGRNSDNDTGFLKKVMSSGTLNDKMASMMLMIQQSPIHRLQVLDVLLKMASKRGKREHAMALETLKDLFETDLLPDRKLRFFHEQPIDEQAARNPTLLVMWYFEDVVKHKFAEFITHLETATHDSLTHVRTKVCRMSYDLLRSKAEQEQANLFLLVNKLGDPDKKVGLAGTSFPPPAGSCWL